MQVYMIHFLIMQSGNKGSRANDYASAHVPVILITQDTCVTCCSFVPHCELSYLHSEPLISGGSLQTFLDVLQSLIVRKGGEKQQMLPFPTTGCIQNGDIFYPCFSSSLPFFLPSLFLSFSPPLSPSSAPFLFAFHCYFSWTLLQMPLSGISVWGQPQDSAILQNFCPSPFQKTASIFFNLSHV